ncbi:Putative ubiquinone biosynthesis monooxygenase [Malassezia nana]|uniref:5-demethoxyubiquinone hydroxylase, mitochondrial n=1 Tax=Malassezia nana TaxID=180528 RepID=A0AAF0J2L8_9BASI|nr:Putative ubiquinone biosynthesis monooxygenase [Malassezia nana]
MLRTGWRRMVQLPVPYRLISSRRAFQTENLASDAFTKEDGRVARMEKALRFVRALDPVDRQTVSSMLRVDHAGEVAANTIYEAQADVFGYLAQVPVKKLILDMWDNEKKHLQAASTMLDNYRTRPSGLLPVWALAGRILGGITACLGEKSAMACTEAVETAIGEHYDDQLQHLSEIQQKLAQKYSGDTLQDLEESLALLRSVLIEFRDDELEHLDTAVEHNSQQAPAHALLSAVVEYGCKGAIEVAKRI